MSIQLAPPAASSSPFPGQLSTYAPGLVCFDGRPSLSQSLVWIGGLYSGLDVAAGPNMRGMDDAISKVGTGWSVVQSVRSSSYRGWGYSSIRRDAEEIALLVEFLVKVAGKTKLIIMGHSTGTQDVIAFFHCLKRGQLPGLSAEAAAAVVGSSMLAAASDREYLEKHKPHELIQKHIAPPAGSDWDEFIPLVASEDPFGPARITYRRWRSLAARRELGATTLDIDVSEDFFSTDLSDEYLRHAVFESVDRPQQILLCGQDETFVDSAMDRQTWIERLLVAQTDEARTSASGLVKDADHSVTTEQGQKNLFAMVVNFLQTL